MKDYRKVNLLAIIVLAALCCYLFLKYQLVAEAGEVGRYAFELAASQSRMKDGIRCTEALEILNFPPDEVAQSEEGVTYRWSTYYRTGFYTQLFHEKKEHGHYWVDIRCDSNGQVIRFNYGSA